MYVCMEFGGEKHAYVEGGRGEECRRHRGDILHRKLQTQTNRLKLQFKKEWKTGKWYPDPDIQPLIFTNYGWLNQRAYVNVQTFLHAGSEK